MLREKKLQEWREMVSYKYDMRYVSMTSMQVGARSMYHILKWDSGFQTTPVPSLFSQSLFCQDSEMHLHPSRHN